MPLGGILLIGLGATGAGGAAVIFFIKSKKIK
jgi:hypothetical protein